LGNEVVGGRTIDVHIRKLREKIGKIFKTIKGVISLKCKLNTIKVVLKIGVESFRTLDLIDNTRTKKMKVSFKTYKFAVKSALYITFFNGFVLLLVSIMFNLPSVGCIYLVFMLIVYLFSFIVLQYRVERFIYRRKKIYDDVSL
jgi:hypothetical protein